MSAVKSNVKSNERNILLKKYVERNEEEMKKMKERKKMKMTLYYYNVPLLPK
jgi:hypothetical protein